MPLYDWQCEAGHQFSRKAGYETPVLPCACGLPASRQSVYRINFGGFASTPMGQADFRDDYRRFNEATNELAYKKERFEDSAQVKTEAPRLYSQAKAEAKKLESAGLTSDAIST